MNERLGMMFSNEHLRGSGRCGVNSQLLTRQVRGTRGEPRCPIVPKEKEASIRKQ